MRNPTRQLYNAFVAQIAQLNGVDAAATATKFSIAPTIQQKLEDVIQESSGFLQKINVILVTEKEGQVVGLSVPAPIASTTNTALTKREPKDVTSTDKTNEYNCTQTNYDTYIPYSKLDIWAKFPDFQTRIRNLIVQAQALSRIMIGWNGASRAATSDLVANPLLQDVNKGWLQKYRDNAPARVLATGTVTPGQITIGAGGDYENLDALVFDLVNNMIDPWFQDDTELVVICGRSLLADKYFPLVNVNQAPTEQLAADVVISQKRLGGLPAVRVPFFPDGTVMVTRLDNLSIYVQEGARRRTVKEEPESDRVSNFESSNDAFVVENYGLGAVAENIVLTP